MDFKCLKKLLMIIAMQIAMSVCLNTCECLMTDRKFE